MATSNHSTPPTPKGLEASKVMHVCVIGQVNVYPSGGELQLESVFVDGLSCPEGFFQRGTNTPAGGNLE